MKNSGIAMAIVSAAITTALTPDDRVGGTGARMGPEEDSVLVMKLPSGKPGAGSARGGNTVNVMPGHFWPNCGRVSA